MKTLASQDSSQLRQKLKCFIGPISVGLGDLIVSLPVVQAMIDDGYETTVVLRSSVQEGLLHRLEGLFGTIREVDFLALPKDESSFYINLRHHPLQIDHLWGSPSWYEAHGSMKVEQIVTEIASRWAVVPDFSKLKPLLVQPRLEAQGKIIFVPGTWHTFKCWPKSHWLSLKDYFKAKNIDVLLLGQPKSNDSVKDLIGAIDWLDTPQPADALDLISNCRGVVAVDTGLMHMAVHQAVPTVTLYQNRPVYERVYPHTKTVEAAPCHSRCVDNYLDPPENRSPVLKAEILTRRVCDGIEDKSTSLCMTGITVAAVIEAIESTPGFFGQ